MSDEFPFKPSTHPIGIHIDSCAPMIWYMLASLIYEYDKFDDRPAYRDFNYSHFANEWEVWSMYTHEHMELLTKIYWRSYLRED